jgi:hypothetical protein
MHHYNEKREHGTLGMTPREFARNRAMESVENAKGASSHSARSCERWRRRRVTIHAARLNIIPRRKMGRPSVEPAYPN